MNEKLISIGVARNLPILRRDDGKRPDLATIYRWSFRGVRGVKLETWRVGGRMLTTAEAVERFNHAINTGSSDVTAPTPSQRRREIESSKRRLAAAGIV